MNKWISVKDRMPEKSGVPVMAYGQNEYGKGITIRAAWAQKYTLESYNYEGDPDYHEENDMYYWPEGWYEWNEYEDTHWYVNFEITHWMPIPEPPTQEEESDET